MYHLAISDYSVSVSIELKCHYIKPNIQCAMISSKNQRLPQNEIHCKVRVRAEQVPQLLYQNAHFKRHFWKICSVYVLFQMPCRKLVEAQSANTEMAFCGGFHKPKIKCFKLITRNCRQCTLFVLAMARGFIFNGKKTHTHTYANMLKDKH